MHKWASSWMFVLLFYFVKSFDNGVENWPWWRHAQAPRLQQVAAGQRAELHCAGRYSDAPAVWDYKACGGDQSISCQETINAEQEGDAGEWRRLPHDRSTFTLAAATAGDSGLYRCSEAVHGGTVYTTLELEVLEFTTDEDARLPEFLDGLPKNMTVTTEGQVIMQCKVSSRTRPTIVWLAEGEGPIIYKDKAYSLLNSSGEMALPGGIFLSKMVITQAKISHTGWYYCLAINTKGFSNHSAYLTVVSLPWTGQKGYSSFYWLFLMPLALAVIPALLWTIYLCNRSKSVAKEGVERAQVEMVHLRCGTFKESEII